MAKKRSASEMAKHRRLIAAYYLKGDLQIEIAEKIGISQPTVSRDLMVIQKRWLQETLRDYGEVQARELARIDILEREAWQAWERSQQDAETITKETVGSNKGDATQADRIKQQVVTKGQVGDRSFLSQVEKCIEMRCKILGLYAPTKVAPTTPDGKKSYDPTASIKSEILGALHSISTASAEKDDN